MSALPKDDIFLTEAEYLAFERSSEIKHEYVDGEIFAMAGASEAHNLICSYTIASLIGSLGDKPCRVYPSDMRVKIEKIVKYRYPDIIVVCGEPQFEDEEFDTLLNPTILIEVLSPSTALIDRDVKLREYFEIPSVQEYLLIEQSAPRIERYLRQDVPDKLYTQVAGLESQIELPSIACTLVLSDVYRKVSFEADSDE